MRQDDMHYLLNVYRRLPIDIASAEGSYLIDQNNTRYLDMFCGIAVNTLGHQHPAILHALATQTKSYLHLSNHFTSPSVIALAKILVENSFASKVFFSNSGTEANEAALKLARKWGRSIHPDKVEMIALTHGFHGRTSGSMALTGTLKYKTAFAPLLPKIKHVERNDCASLKDAMSDSVCAIFLEVIQGEGGIQPLQDSFLSEVQRLADKHQVLIVIDEIQTGLLRTGKMFAYEHTILRPDLVTLAKSLGGGLPLGALLVSAHLENVFEIGDHGTTFGGNPLACALGHAVMTELLDPSFQKTLKNNMDYFDKNLQKIHQKYPKLIKAIRGRGYLIGIDVGVHAPRFQQKMYDHRVLINITQQTIIRLLPALTMERKDLKLFIETLDLISSEIQEEGMV